MGHPPSLHQTLTVVDGLVAGLHRSFRQPGLPASITPQRMRCRRTKRAVPGAGDAAGNRRRSRPPRPAPRAGHAHVLLARALITTGNHPRSCGDRSPLRRRG
jgi:hypothetical protein